MRPSCLRPMLIDGTQIDGASMIPEEEFQQLTTSSLNENTFLPKDLNAKVRSDFIYKFKD